MSEARTAQFLIERRCELEDSIYAPGQSRAAFEARLPFCCWVYVEAIPLFCRCGASSYRVATQLGGIGADGVLGSLYTPVPGFSPAVCEHMGRLIE